MPDGLYAVICRGVERTILSRSQISFDSPNRFTDAFLIRSESSQAKNRIMYLDIHPRLFDIIVDYLSGEDVIPLQPDALPRTMSLEKATRSLARHAENLRLNGLAALLKQQPPAQPPIPVPPPPSPPPKPKTYGAIAGYSFEAELNLRFLLTDHIPEGAVWKTEQLDAKPLPSNDGKYIFIRAKDFKMRFVPCQLSSRFRII
jgi:hypothetical protein